MTDKEIQQACLDAYTDALENLPDNFYEALDFLSDRDLELGLCYYLQNKLELKLEDVNWLNRPKSYWYMIPNICDTTEQIRESLQFRINKLQELLS